MLVAVRLSTAVVVKPATCAVDNSVTVSAFRLPDDSALSCVDRVAGEALEPRPGDGVGLRRAESLNFRGRQGADAGRRHHR